MVIFKYPSEIEAYEVEIELERNRQGVISADKKSVYIILLATVLLIFSLSTSGIISNILYVTFVVLIMFAYMLRKFPKKISKYIFVTAYNDRIHIIAYESDLISKTEILAMYDDVIKFKYKKGKLKMLIYETENSYVVKYNSEGKIVESTTIFCCNISKNSEIDKFLTEVAPILFN